MVNSNTSATGGYLLPAPAPTPLEGAALLAFLQGYVVGVTGLPGDMVRPRWQPEPPNIPQAGNLWAAIGVTSRPTDTYAFTRQLEDTSTELQRHEELDMLCSFYDLGSGGLADNAVALLRDGLQVDQNREPLFLAGMGLVGSDDPVAVPSLLKMRWLYRVDMNVKLRRVILRNYPVLTILSETGVLRANEAGEGVITTDISTP